jgi:hypothetical protein
LPTVVEDKEAECNTILLCAKIVEEGEKSIVKASSRIRNCKPNGSSQV